MAVIAKKKQGRADYQTKMKILYSDSGIYNLFYCEDTFLTSTLREDFSDLFNEDVVEAFFWTDEKVTIYFEYELSPSILNCPYWCRIQRDITWDGDPGIMKTDGKPGMPPMYIKIITGFRDGPQNFSFLINYLSH